MNKKPIVDQDRRRKRALMVFQILMYGYLVTMFLIQLHMYSGRDW
jgi:predicted nucleic acid-binding Zn ribbon protein